MATTYEPIATTTLGSAQASYTFSSIPATYTDLRMVFSGTGSVTGNVSLQFNGSSAAYYSSTELYGDGTTAASTRVSNQTALRLGSVNTSQSTSIGDIFNYANTTTYKTTIGRTSSTAYTDTYVSLWRGSTGSSTEAITSVTVSVSGGNIGSGTVLTLYGIKAA
jgi:hypothetical protein